MEKSYSASYAAAGVDITAGYRSVELMKQYVARTMTESCIGGLGGFGGLFELDCTGMEHPVLISGTDGVGTKLRIAMLLDKHDTIGIDCVAMCVNDVICAGAKPLVFLDYIACGKNIPEKIAEIVKGVAEGCVQAGCSLVGGETAEHPGMMPEDEYDLAGFTVGVVDKAKILDNSTMQPGDVIIDATFGAGGYTRVLKAGFRHGDSAPVAVIEFVDRDNNIDYDKVLTETASAVSELLSLQCENDVMLRNALKQLGYECK